MISSSLTQIVSSTLPPLSSKSGKVWFSSTKLVIEQKYLFKTSAFSLNDIPPIQDPKNNYCLSYEGKEKADVLNKYFCSITNLVDENQTLPDFDDRGGNVLETIWVREGSKNLTIIYF
jgi:hypothetical protein